MITVSEDSDVSNCVRSINLNNEAPRADLGCTVTEKITPSSLLNNTKMTILFPNKLHKSTEILQDPASNFSTDKNDSIFSS